MKMKREVKVGLYMLLMLAALYWGINFLRGKDLFNRTNTYYATYEQVNGIQKSSAIMIKGFKVGVVSDIMYDPVSSEKIVLAFNIRSKYKIPANSEARVFSDGLLGGKAIEIILGDAEGYLKNRDTLHSSADPDLLAVAGSELERITYKVSQVADNLTLTLTSLNGILSENKDNIDITLGNLAQMSSSLNYTITNERDNLRGIISNINEFTMSLSRNAAHVDSILLGLGTFSNSLAQVDIKGVAHNLNSTLEDVEELVAGLRNGEGTLGRLVTDEALFESLNQAVGNLSALLEDLKANPGKYVNITVFGGRQR